MKKIASESTKSEKPKIKTPSGTRLHFLAVSLTRSLIHKLGQENKKGNKDKIQKEKMKEVKRNQTKPASNTGQGPLRTVMKGKDEQPKDELAKPA